jgi:hypothetical protein
MIESEGNVFERMNNLISEENHVFPREVSPATHILQRSRVASEQKNDLNVP